MSLCKGVKASRRSRARVMEGSAIDLSPPPGATEPSPSEPPSEREHAREWRSSVIVDVKLGSVGEAGRLTTWGAHAITSSSVPVPAPPSAADESTWPASIDERSLGLWTAAGVQRRAFGRRSGGRLISALGLLTPSWRVEHPHAVATLIA